MSARRIVEIALGIVLALVLVAVLRSCSSSAPREIRVEAVASATSTTTPPVALTEPASSSTSSPAASTTTTAETLAPAPPSSARPASTSLPRASRSATPRPSAGSLGVFESTCYELRGTTASGRPAGPGSIAVDPRVIPLGTRLRVEGYGDGIAADTGGAIKGRRIDVWKASGCREWGRRSVAVEILE